LLKFTWWKKKNISIFRTKTFVPLFELKPGNPVFPGAQDPSQHMIGWQFSSFSLSLSLSFFLSFSFAHNIHSKYMYKHKQTLLHFQHHPILVLSIFAYNDLTHTHTHKHKTQTHIHTQTQNTNTHTHTLAFTLCLSQKHSSL